MPPDDPLGRNAARGPDAARPPAGRPGVLLVLFIALTQFSSAFMHAIMGVALPAMGRDLGASGVELGLAETVFLAMSVSLLLPIGRFADATDKNTLLKAGLLALAAATCAIGLQPTMTAVIACRLLQGAAAAFITATGMAIVADLAPPGRMGRMLGLAIGATYVGLASGPFFSGLVTTHLGWRWVFFLAAAPPLAAFLLSRTTLESRWRAPAVPVNLPNSALLAASIASVVALGATLGRTSWSLGLGGLALAFGAFYLVRERRSTNPLVRIGDVRANRPLSRALAVQFLVYCGTVGTTFLLSVHLQVVRGGTPEEAGHVLVAGPIVMAALAPVAGRFSDRVAPHRIAALGAASILCSVALAALVSPGSGLAHFVAIMAFQGLGFALFSAPNIAIIMNSVAPGDRGLASALSGLMRSTGMMVSMFIVTASLSLGLGTAAVADDPDAFGDVLTGSFVVFAALTALGAAVAARSGAAAPTRA